MPFSKFKDYYGLPENSFYIFENLRSSYKLRSQCDIGLKLKAMIKTHWSTSVLSFGTLYQPE